MEKIRRGRVWPYAISMAILLFFGAIVFSIFFILEHTPVQRSHTYMMGYDHANLQANELIQSRIDFDEKYKITYITESLAQEGSTLKYKLRAIDGTTVNDAIIKVIITRPEHHGYDQELINPSVEDGVYSFENFTLAKPGRWNIMAKFNVGELQRFYNVKADTRVTEVKEY